MSSTASPIQTQAEPADDAPPHVRAVLFDSEGSDRAIEALDELASMRPGEKQLLWVDMQGATSLEIEQVTESLGLPEDAIEAMTHPGTTPSLTNCGAWFWLRVVSVIEGNMAGFQGSVLTLLAGRNIVVSCHQDPIAFIDHIRVREAGDTAIGRLGAASFLASLLDWQVSTYLEAVSRFENSVERFEVDLLTHDGRDALKELRDLRKGASRLRRMLAPHRVVFSGMARPDFRPQENGRADQHFLALHERFERAMDVVENARDLVIGSFELFTSQNAVQTNRQMHLLTFVTVVIGILAVLAGVLGMNFQASFFESASTGFWSAIGGMCVVVIAAVIVARKRRWI